ncbi:MAG: hypothetical protein IJB24_00005, partial [Clostridia bacterium]|nr:hypothetical protein [Clostridia bacterium]
LNRWMQTEALCGIGLEDCCALVGIDGRFSVLTSSPDAKAHIFKNENGSVSKEYRYDGEAVNL